MQVSSIPSNYPISLHATDTLLEGCVKIAASVPQVPKVVAAALAALLAAEGVPRPTREVDAVRGVIHRDSVDGVTDVSVVDHAGAETRLVAGCGKQMGTDQSADLYSLALKRGIADAVPMRARAEIMSFMLELSCRSDCGVVV